MTSYNCLPVSRLKHKPRPHIPIADSVPLQLHESYNIYVSPSSYIFEPSTAQVFGADGQSEKDVRESLHVDRKTGQFSLNGRCHRRLSIQVAGV